jgi:signal transduction histidine kinase
VAARWDAPVEPGVSQVPRGRLQQLLEADPATDGKRFEPVRRPSGELLGVIEYRLPSGRAWLAPPERTALDAVAKGVAVALRNTESYFQLQKVNQELAENERVASLGVMAGALAHEIKNPLASLKMGLYLLRRDSRDPGRLDRIEGDVRRIDDLVSSMLRFTADTQHEPREPIDLCAALDAVVCDLATLARDRGVHVEQHVLAERAIILGGTSELRVLLSNILRNSLDACSPGGRIAVRLGHDSNEVKIEVEDNGHGIPPGLRRRVFDLNFSTKPEGSGLGLALARREAERLGGRIELESGRGRGTTLRVVLPAAEEIAERRAE